MVAQFKSGDFVRTEHLAAELGVSQTPVREAMMILQSEGSVRWEPRRGYRVAPITRQDVSDLFQVQAFVAGELAARAAELLDDEALSRIEGWAAASAHDHTPVLAALRERDPDGARTAMTEHIRHVGEQLVDHLRGQGTLH
ncbi:GntR family transcriptional regulator [Parafrankia discariae]|uniref:GntR family transcriptional regulator n=1 Tax=Parafrankia discariae TaxID=365528 RepID=UPI00037ED35A|nr:GntR family transcriptional regulator [Parafrankia discariae]